MTVRPRLCLQDVELSLGGQALLPRISFCVEGGEVRTIMGPSGSGKSSLLAYVCGVLPRAFQASGRIILNDVDVTDRPLEHRRVGILFQDDFLFPHMTVGENLLFALRRGNGAGNRRQRAEAALEEAGLADFFDRDPGTLSGGQRARAAVMRTLLSEPYALLLDEPFSKLDAETKDSFRTFVFGHARRYLLPTLLVTHDPADARAAGGVTVEIGQTV